MNNLSDYQVAALQWLEENLGKTLDDCRPKEVVIFSDGKIMALGNYLSRIRGIYKAMQKGKRYGGYRNLSLEEIEWWKSQGLSFSGFRNTNHLEKLKEYQAAALQWLEENPGKSLDDCKCDERVTLVSLKVVALGSYFSRVRRIYRAMQNGEKCGGYYDLTEEEIEWWKGHDLTFGDSFNKQHLKRLKEYQEAALQWLEENPGKSLNDCKYCDKVTLASGKEISLGYYISRVCSMYRAMQKGTKYKNFQELTKEEIQWWSDHGIDWSIYKHNKYQVAALLWLEEHPGKMLSDCKSKEVVIFSDGKIIALGNYLAKIRSVYKAMQNGEVYGRTRRLTKEEISWWSSHGIDWNVRKYQKKNKSTGSIRVDVEQEMFEDRFEDIYRLIVKKFDKQNQFNENTILEIAEEFLLEDKLTLSEKKVLYQRLKKYWMSVKEKNIIRVGLESSEDEKLEKIQKYGLDEFDIEESFFAFLEFEKDLSLKRKYEILKGYIIDWSYYSMEERLEVQRQNGFSLKDMQYIEDTRKSIDELIQKVKVKVRGVYEEII